MKNALCSCLLAFSAFAASSIAAGAQTREAAFAHASWGSCVNSPEGFNSHFQPQNIGVTWRTTFNAVGTSDEDGHATETGQLVDSASFGAGPRMHSPAAHVYQETFTATATKNPDGSETIVLRDLRGRFIEGPLAGVTFAVSPGLRLKQWRGQGTVAVQATAGTPVIQTVSLSKGRSFQRICIVTTIVTSRH